MNERNRTVELGHRNYKRFRDLVQEKSGLYFPEEKRLSLSRRLVEALEQSSCANLDEYYELLRASPSNNCEWDRLVSALTVGETYFFRNKGHFDALANHILPEIIARQQRSNRRIRIWSAGCATGEESYSVAILLRELIPDISNWSILILGTDINRDALSKAREGVYGSWSFRDVRERIKRTYFRAADKQHAINDEIKRMVTFYYLNLIQDHYPSLSNNTHAMDVILCRNVTIYFTPEETDTVVGQFYKSLTGGGWLIPGASEPNMTTYQDYDLVSLSGAVVYCKPALEKAKKPESTLKALPSATEAIEVNARHAAPEPSPTTDPYHMALKYLEKAQIDNALTQLHKTLDQNPDFALAYYALSKIYANKGDLEKAQHWCERAIERDKLRPEPYFTLSMIYQGYDLLDQATDALRKALFLDSGFTLAHYSLANIYLKQGKKKLAYRSLRNAQRLLIRKPEEEPVPEGDGLVTGRLLRLVEMALANGL